MNSNRSRRSARPWYVVLLATVAAGVIIFGVTQLGAPTTSAARTSTEDVTAEDGVVQTTVSGSGEVEPGVDDTLNFSTSGTLQSVDVRVGQHVKKGQLIATLDPSSAELTLEQARASLTTAEDNLKEVESGTSTGSSSTGSSSSSSGSSVATAAAASATTVYAALRRPADAATTDTTTTDTTTDTTTSPVTDTVTVTVPATTTTPTTGASNTRTGKPTTSKKQTASKKPTTSKKPTRKKTRTGTEGGTGGSTGQGTSKSSAKTTASAATTTSKPTAAQIQQAQVQVDEARATVSADQKAVSETKLYAPAAGTIASLSSDSIGQTVSGGSSSSGSAAQSQSTGSSSAASSSSSTSSGFAQLVNDNTMTMTVSVSEDDISSVKVGQMATVSITALSGVELAGRVSSISPLGTDSSGVVSYDVTVSVTQSNPKVLPGMSATATIVTKQAQGVTVPNEAISGTGSAASVTLVANGKTTTQPVVVGLRGSSRSQIVSGLKAGQQVQITITLPALGTSTTSSSSSSSSTGGFGGAGGFGGGGGFGGAGGFRAAARAFLGGGAGG